MTARPVSSPLRLLSWLLTGLLLAWLALAQLPGRSLLDLGSPALSPAEWIWPEGPRDRRSPLAFWAIEDFVLAAPQAAVVLEVTADEEYVAYLDGRRVGFGRFAAGRGLDAWHLAEGLEIGPHRLLIEVRSGRGAGGLLARLSGDDGAVLAATGEPWRVERRAVPGVLSGWMPLADGDATLVWGPAGIGRWTARAAPSPRPARPAVAPSRLRLPSRARLVGDLGSWRPRSGANDLLTLPEPVPGVIFDFGEVVSGLLHLDLGGDENVRSALALLSDRPVDPFAGSDAGVGDDVLVRPVVPVPGSRRWQAVEAVEFRYATILGAIGGAAAWLEPAPAEEVLQEPSPGPLGLDGPRLRTPIEDEIRRELQRFPGLTGAEEL